METDLSVSPSGRDLDRETLDKTLGIRYLELSKEKVVAELEVTPKVHQPFGFLHGGPAWLWRRAWPAWEGS